MFILKESLNNQRQWKSRATFATNGGHAMSPWPTWCPSGLSGRAGLGTGEHHTEPSSVTEGSWTSRAWGSPAHPGHTSLVSGHCQPPALVQRVLVLNWRQRWGHQACFILETDHRGQLGPGQGHTGGWGFQTTHPWRGT